MRKEPEPFFGFLAIYIGLISIVFLAHATTFPGVFINYSFASNFSCSMALASLTQVSGNVFATYIPSSYIVFSLIITQLSGTTLLSFLLYYCWKIFGEKHQKSMTVKVAFLLTSKISLLVEGFLLMFFLYSISMELTMDWGQKTIAALSLAVNSFFAAGFTHNAHFFHEGTVANNFLIQIGIIVGTTIGGLGIFVVHELFSPIKLRERLANPEIDWTFITKVSVFGSALVIGLASILIYFFNAGIHWSEKPMIETVIASIYQATSARGFGFSIVPSNSWIESMVSVLGAGPFSTGGGITILSFAFLAGIYSKKLTKSMDFMKLRALLKPLIIYGIVSFLILTSLVWPATIEVTLADIFMDQLALFTTNNLDLYLTNAQMIVQGITNFLGRVGFLMACAIVYNQKSL